MTEPAETPSIEVRHLRKVYGEVVAVDDLTFRVDFLKSDKLSMPDIGVPVPVIMNSELAKKNATAADPWAMEWCKNNHASGGAYKVEKWQPSTEVVFVRSDQFSFIKQGIPAVFPVSANDGSPDGLSEVAHWRTDHYHSPQDDLTQPFDWASGARFTSMAFWAAWLAADHPRAPQWNAGDFFGERFGPRP